MKHLCYAIFCLLCSLPLAAQTAQPAVFHPADSNPFFFDKEWGGAADPVMVWNEHAGEWFVYYTQRRAYYQGGGGTEWIHGCTIGIASSPDGRQWTYRGSCRGNDNLTNAEHTITWWAPEVIAHNGLLHMFVSNPPGVFKNWNAPRHIKHFTSTDGFTWKYQSTLPLSSERCIDAGVHRVGDRWYVWYKDEAHSHTWCAESIDLYNWKVVGEAVADCEHEAPFVWQYAGKYWMIVDAWRLGLRIYESADGRTNWKYNSTVQGSHPAVYPIGDRLVFLCHRVVPPANGEPRNGRVSALYMGELVYQDGKFTLKMP
jgi:hypothetical protein